MIKGECDLLNDLQYYLWSTHLDRTAKRYL